jgi:hypothetical protein
LIMRHIENLLTSLIEASGRQRAGGTMVIVFCGAVCCVVCACGTKPLF